MGRGTDKIKWPIHPEVNVHLILQLVFLPILFKIREKKLDSEWNMKLQLELGGEL